MDTTTKAEPTTHVRVPTDLAERIRGLAKAEHRTLIEVVRRALQAELDRSVVDRS